MLGICVLLLLGMYPVTNVRAQSPQATDDASYTETVSPQSITGYYLYDVVWSGTRWVAVGSGSLNEALVLTSPDGATWGKVSLGKSRQLLGLSKKGVGTLYGIAWNGSRLVAVGEKLLTSVDGNEWSVAAEFPRCKLARVATNGTMFVAVGGYYSNGCAVSSPDGVTWADRTKELSGEGAVLTDVIWTGTAFVALGNISRGKFGVTTVVFTSADGSAWTRQTIANSSLVSLTWNESLFIGVGGAGRQGSVFFSADGKSWTRGRVQVSAPLRSIAWNGTRFVAVGMQGEIHTSPEGQAWTKRSSNTTRDLLRVAWSGTHFVAVGRGIIIRSADGMMWELPRP
jgi:hypothetical protein